MKIMQCDLCQEWFHFKCFGICIAPDSWLCVHDRRPASATYHFPSMIFVFVFVWITLIFYCYTYYFRFTINDTTTG